MNRFDHLRAGFLIAIFFLACVRSAVAFDEQRWALPTAASDGGGEVVSYRSGRQVGAAFSDAGDFNGDGIDDLLVGSPGSADDGSPPYTGAVYVVYGAIDFPTRPPTVVDNMSASDGVALTPGGQQVNAFGERVASAGDMNGDGLGDVVMSFQTSIASSSRHERIAVVFGSRNHGLTFSVASLNGNNGFTLIGGDGQDQTGFVISAAGDINADGLDDLLITAPFADVEGAEDSGRAYIIFGKTSFPAEIALAGLTASDGVILQSTRQKDELGYTASGLGDFNADGFDDVLLGGFGVDPGRPTAENGRAYVVYGAQQMPLEIDVNALDGRNGFMIDGFFHPNVEHGEVRAIGDVNGDGYDDFTLTYNTERLHTSWTSSAQRENFLIFGHRQSARSLVVTGNPEQSTYLGNVNITYQDVPETADRRTSAGWIHGVGDVDNDGYDDLLFRSNRSSFIGTFIFRFGDRYFPKSMYYNRGAFEKGFEIVAPPGLTSGYVGDLNNDGYDDIVVGYPEGNDNVAVGGRVVIGFGRKGADTPNASGHIYEPVYLSIPYYEGGIDPTPDTAPPPPPTESSSSSSGASNGGSGENGGEEVDTPLGVAGIGGGNMERALVAEYLFDRTVKDNSRFRNNLVRRQNASFRVDQNRRVVMMRHQNRGSISRASTPTLSGAGHLAISFTAKSGDNREYTPVVGHFTKTKILQRYYLSTYSVQLLPRGAVRFVYKPRNDQNIWSCTSRSGVVNHGRWNHYAITRNRATGLVVIYLNGKRVDVCRGPVGNLESSDGRVFYLGTYPQGIIDDATTDLFLDDLQVYKRLLSPEEVRDIAYFNGLWSSIRNGGGTLVKPQMARRVMPEELRKPAR